MTDPTFAGTLPAIQRTQDHRYIYEGVTYPGVTNVLKTIDKGQGMQTWAARETANALMAIHDNPGIDAMINMVGRDGVIKAATARANWQRDEAANFGSKVHAWADDMVSGRPLPALTDTETIYAEHYARWWEKSGWRLRISEACVVAPKYDGGRVSPEHEGWGGTFDLLCFDADERTVLADLKTGKGVYREAILQLTAYSMAPLVSPMASPDVYPMPQVDRHVIIHVTREGVREVELSVGAREWSAWLSVLDLYRWTETVKGKL